MKKTGLVYGLLLAAAVAGFFAIRHVGERLSPPQAPLDRAADAAVVGAAPNVLPQVLLALAAVILLGRVLSRLLKHFGQPPVIGEVLAGIVLGPSVLGLVFPAASTFLLPASAAPFLGVIAQFGVVLYMFLVGLELDTSSLRGRVHSVVAISHASIVLPFILGAGLALYIYPRFAPPEVPFTAFALFMGLAMSITAFPVLARILSDRGMTRTDLGVLALTCASVDDVTAWCLLAFVVGVIQTSASGAVLSVVLTLAFVATMFLVVRPMLESYLARTEGRSGAGSIPAVLAGLLISALATEAIGIHAIFGAFLFGVVFPAGSRMARSLHESLGSVVGILLLPAFFAFTGMRTEIGLLSDGYQWLVCAVIVLAATAGKFGGTFVSAVWAGISPRQAGALGVLMNTRGLMELIVLNVGLELGVITPTLYAMMVLMALATTIATTPALKRLTAPEPAAEAALIR